MRVAEYKTFVVAPPPPRIGGRWWLFVKLTTACGICGIGEAYGIPFSPATAERLLADVCERRALGANPLQVEELWRRVYADGYAMRPDITVMGALSAIEMACWDIAGKASGKPVYDLLGGRVRDSLRAYTYLYPSAALPNVYDNADEAAQRAAEYAREGFTAVKFDAAGPYTAYDPRQLGLAELTRAEEFAKKIREAVGGRCDLLFGTHGQMTPAAAIRLARRLQPFDPLWLEEPTPPDNPAGMAQVAAGCDIPIAAGEHLCAKYEFAALLRHNAAHILQPNLGRCGGILEAKKIAGMAEAFHAQVAPHLYCGPIVGAANIQLAACSPNFLILEGVYKWGGFYADILQTPVQWQNGHVVVPTAPGLGVELNEAVAEANRPPAEEANLHLAPLEREFPAWLPQGEGGGATA